MGWCPRRMNAKELEAQNYIRTRLMSTQSVSLNFPDWFPSDCPPLTADDAAGIVFRFATKSPVAAEDFLSQRSWA